MSGMTVNTRSNASDQIPPPSGAEYFNVAIAGAGPAGLACAHAVVAAAPAARVLLLEAGRPLLRRPCPVDRGRACTGCAGICNVVSGFGGSMHYGDGVKLSLLPSGRRLVPHLGGRQVAEAWCRQAFAWLTGPLESAPPLVGENLSPWAVEAFAADELAIRSYPVAVLGESQLRQVLTGLHGELEHAVDLRHGAELAAAATAGDGVDLRVRTRSGEYAVRVGHLVLATGRRGVAATEMLLHRLGAEVEQPDISVGIRLEMAVDVLDAIGGEHPDLKISQYGAGERLKVKTFCFCGGGNGGRIKFTNYEGAFGEPIITLDGHETTERTAVDGRALSANFGLLAQVAGRGGATEARDSFLAGYRKLGAGQPMVQTLAAFLNRSAGQPGWPELSARMPFTPSIADLRTGPVHELFTPGEHASLTAGATQLLGAIQRYRRDGEPLAKLAEQILVVAPELEFLWGKPRTDASCRIDGTPVYVIGDAAGVAQGVVQAAMTGLAAGADIAARLAAAGGE